MKQKYILTKKKNDLAIKEVAQTEPGSFSTMYEMTLPLTNVEEAIEGGLEAIKNLFRSRHFYPTSFFADILAEGIIKIVKTEPADSLQIDFNDIESLETTKERAAEADKVENEKELAEIDKLLEDDDDAFEIDADPTSAPDASAGSAQGSAQDKPA